MSDAPSHNSLWALCDQGIISAGNFCTSLILIRTLPANEFGVFALLLNALLFLNNVHASTVTYTVLIKGAQSDDRSLRKVASGGLVATLGLAILSVIALCFATSYVAHRDLLVFVVAASLCWQIQEVLRTVFVARLSYRRAIAGDALSYLGQASVLAVLCHVAKPTLPAIFLAIAGTSLLAALVQGVQIRPSAITLEWMRSFRNEVWVLGRWSVLAKLVAFFGVQAFPWVLAYRHGMVSVAAFQALFQLVALTNPILLSSNNLIMASIAKNRRRGFSSIATANRYMLYSGGAVAVYFAGLLLGGGRVMSLFYGSSSTYLLNAPLLPLFVAAYALEFASMFAGATLAGMEKTRPLFIQQLWGMFVAVFLVLPFVARLGLRAAVIGLVFVNAAKALAGWYLVRVSRLNIEREAKPQTVLAAL